MAWPWHDASVYQVFINTVARIRRLVLGGADTRTGVSAPHDLINHASLLLARRGLLRIRPRHYARTIRGVRDFAELGIGALDTGMIEQ